MSHNTLPNYYKTSFSLTYDHKLISITELERMIPFERDLYVDMLKDDMEQKEERRRQQQAIDDVRNSRRK